MKNKEVKSIFSSLENFSSIPPPELWDKIEAELDEPKNKKRPVIWWWLAAGLVAGLSIPSVLYFNSNQRNAIELNIENNRNEVVLQNALKGDLKSNKSGNHNKNTVENASLDKKNNVARKSGKQDVNANGSHVSLANSNLVVVNTSSVISSKMKDLELIKSSKRGNKNQFLNKNDNKSQLDAIVVGKIATNNSYQSASTIGRNNFYATTNSNTKAKPIVTFDGNNTLSGSKENINTKSIVNIYENNGFSESKNNKEKVESINTKLIINTDENNTFSELKNNKEKTEIINNKSIVNIYENNSVSGLNNNKGLVQNTKTKDSLATIKKEVAQLEHDLVNLDKDKTQKKKILETIDKWSVQVFAGVMSSQNFSNEKALGNTVASKQSNGFGVKTNYKLNKKWAVSSGFKINELGQKIDGVSYYERGNSQSMVSGLLPMKSNNVSPDAPSKNNTIVFASTNENYLFDSNSKSSTGFETGNVTQNLKYFEMPLEISYALLSKKKTNISLNTGGFVGKLISNEMLLNGSSIGENKNVNEYVYGTLLSSTLQYEFYKKTKFFIEPGMNYYINPLENQSFNQFQWMFNVGFNVSF